MGKLPAVLRVRRNLHIQQSLDHPLASAEA